MSTTITAYGWELHFIGGKSDKFYRVIVAGNATIIRWGRRDTAGQVKVYEFGNSRDALNKAREMSNEKDEKGYQVTRELTAFEVDEDAAHRGWSGVVAVDRLNAEFLAAARTQGSALAGASS